MPKPKMVVISTLGSSMVIHLDRVWGNAEYENRAHNKNAWFVGHHLWSLYLKYENNASLK
jgi:hypothetical protein